MPKKQVEKPRKTRQKSIKKVVKSPVSKTQIATSLRIKRSRYLKAIVVMLLAVLTSYWSVIGIMYFAQSRAVAESPKTEQRRVPQTIVQKLEQVVPIASIRMPILMYHYVEYVTDKNDTMRERLNVQPHVFDAQVKTLKDAGYTFLFAGDIPKIMKGQMKPPKKPVALTFDDGHWDLATDVLPILQKYNARATAYIISGFIDNLDFLTRAQLVTLNKSASFELGCHTAHHVSLAGVFDTILKSEVAGCKTSLETMIGKPVVSFAYPNGSYDEAAARAVKEAGYTNAVSTVPGITVTNLNKFFMYRIRPGQATGEYLISLIENYKDPVLGAGVKR